MLNSPFLKGTDVVHAGAYALADTNAHYVAGWVNRTFSTFGRDFSWLADVDFTVEARWDKDIDSLIVNDMWRVAGQFEKEMYARYEPVKGPLQLRYVLISGDGDYIDTYRQIQELYVDIIEFELVVYGWEGNVNKAYRSVADHIRYLDNIPSFVKEKRIAVS